MPAQHSPTQLPPERRTPCHDPSPRHHLHTGLLQTTTAKSPSDNGWAAVLFTPHKGPAKIVSGALPPNLLQQVSHGTNAIHFLEAWAALIAPTMAGKHIPSIVRLRSSQTRANIADWAKCSVALATGSGLPTSPPWLTGNGSARQTIYNRQSQTHKPQATLHHEQQRQVHSCPSYCASPIYN